MTATEIPSRFGQLMRRPGPRLACLGLLILLLLIPLSMIESRVNERGARRDEAAGSVAQSWGQAQSIAGPILRVPYLYRWTETDKGGRTTQHVRDEGFLWLPPSALDAKVRIESQTRRRGIFEVPVYTARVRLSGRWLMPDATRLPVALDLIDVSRVQVVIGVAEPAALSAQTRASVGGQALTLEPSGLGLVAQGVNATVPNGLTRDQLARGTPFEFELELKGSSSFYLTPVARDTTMVMESNWPHPEFRGVGLPTAHEISARGFTANWSVSHLGRGFPSVWLNKDVEQAQIEASSFGVELCVPVDPYRMAERIAKYGALLLLLSFAVIWVMELLGGRPLHPVQYLLMGGSLCLFGLLQLALAEHLGFAVAFVLAAAAVVLQASWYARVATHSTRRAVALGGLLGGWFGYLYVVLQAEDLAFLLGALALFAALTAVMWATRKVNWSSSAHWDVADTTLG